MSIEENYYLRRCLNENSIMGVGFSGSFYKKSKIKILKNLNKK